MAATLTSENGYLIYTTEGKIVEIPYSLLSICTIIKDTQKVSIILPSETNAHVKSFVDIYPTAVLTTIDAVEMYIKDAQVQAQAISGASTAIADYKISATNFTTSAIQITVPPSLVLSNSAQIVYVKQIDEMYNSVTYVNGAGGYTLDFDGFNQISLYKNGVEYDGFSTNASSSWEVGINSSISLIDTVGNSPMPLAPNYVSPYDFSVAYTSAVTLTCSGSPFDIDSSICNLVSLVVARANGSVTKYLHGNNGVSLSAVGNVVTITGAGTTPFLNTDTKYRLGVNYQQKAYDPISNSNNTFINNYPVQPIQLDLLDTTNVTAATNYYPSSDGIDMSIFNAFSLSGYILDTDGVITMTLEGTNDEDLSTGDWHTIYAYNLITNAQEASWAVTNTGLYFALILKDFKFNNVRVKVVNNGNTNTMRLKGRLTY